LTIAFYYGITGFACVVYYRKHLFESVKNFVMLALLPFAGGLMLFAVMIKAIIFYGHAVNGYAKPLFGIGSPDAIAFVTIIVGLVLMVYQRIKEPEFFKTNKRSVVPEEIVHGAPAGLRER
jgi:hypothetical protein